MRAVNLIPGEQRSGGAVGAGRSQGAAYAVLALLVIVAALAVLYGKASRTVSSDKSKAATLSAEASRAQSEAQALAPYTSFAALRQQRQKAVEELVDQRFDWAHAIHEFGRVLSGEVSLTSLDGTIAASATPAAAPAASASASSPSATSAASVASATPTGSVPTFQIAGCATSQRAVADTMQRLRLIDGVSEVTLQSSTRANGTAASTAPSSGGAPGGCGPTDPVFQMTVTFDALPPASSSAAAAESKTSTVADSASPAEPSTGGETE